MLHDPNQMVLFPKLTEQEMQRLYEHGREIHLNKGDIIFKEGDPSYHFYVVLEGKIQATKKLGAEEQVLTIHQKGEFTGEISMLTGKPARATGCAIAPSRVLEIDHEAFKRMLAQCSQGAQVIISALAGRSQEVEMQMRQQEKLAALGKLSAGLAHELNNPAAAGGRSAQQLGEAIANLQSLTLKLYDQTSKQQRQLLNQLQQQSLGCKSPKLDPLTQSDREDALAQWLEEHEISNGWQLAPTLVSKGIDEKCLETLVKQMPTPAFGEALTWLEASLTVAGLVKEVEHSSARISELVKAIKAYSYMDQAPLKEFDLHEGLDNTLTILHYKLKHGVNVKRDYDQNIPHICAYGSELNQVWTNLIDNAIDAMQGKGELKIHTQLNEDNVIVEITDNGPGIPPDIQPRVFEPFFTTKGVGEGTGLGLDIVRRIVVQKHHGDIRFDSQPKATRFRISLPIKPPKK